jgi:hypothetical protein
MREAKKPGNRLIDGSKALKPSTQSRCRPLSRGATGQTPNTLFFRSTILFHNLTNRSLNH